MTKSRGIRKRWTPAEEEIIRSKYGFVSSETLAECFGVSVANLRAKARNLGAASYRARSPIPRNLLLAKTCYSCGLFLDSCWYYDHGENRKMADCKRCFAKRSSQYRKNRHSSGKVDLDEYKEKRRLFMKSLQDLSLRFTTKRNSRWSREEDRFLLDNCNRRPIEVAIELGRSYYATSSRRRALGIVVKNDWSCPESSHWAINFPEASKALREMSDLKIDGLT